MNTIEEVMKFKHNHIQSNGCKLIVERLEPLDDGQVLLECVTHKEKVITTVAYAKFCRKPLACAGRGYCPLDYSCIE